MALYVDIEKKCGDFLLKVKFTAEKEVLGLLGASGCVICKKNAYIVQHGSLVQKILIQ